MMENKKDDKLKKLPRLGKWLSWVDKPRSSNKIFIGLILICFVLLCFDLIYPKHGYVEIENIRGFYSLYGFIMFAGLIFLATLLRVLIKRKANFYSPKDINSEKYPEEGIDLVNHND